MLHNSEAFLRPLLAEEQKFTTTTATTTEMDEPREYYQAQETRLIKTVCLGEFLDKGE